MAPAAGAAQLWFPGLSAYAAAFDSGRDPQRDLEDARRRATAARRRVLVMVGGDWCVWCFLLDRHLEMDAEAARLFYTGFEVLRVYYGDDNTNQEFLARFPEFHLFPHFFIVDGDGRVLASLDADVIIADARYDTGLIRELVNRWGAASP
jgi:thioredoxin-related protein